MDAEGRTTFSNMTMSTAPTTMSSGRFGASIDNYSTCVFPRAVFTQPYEADYLLLKPRDGMRLLDLGCGSGAAADYLPAIATSDITCVTNSPVQGDICRS